MEIGLFMPWTGVWNKKGGTALEHGTAHGSGTIWMVPCTEMSGIEKEKRTVIL